MCTQTYTGHYFKHLSRHDLAFNYSFKIQLLPQKLNWGIIFCAPQKQTAPEMRSQKTPPNRSNEVNKPLFQSHTVLTAATFPEDWGILSSHWFLFFALWGSEPVKIWTVYQWSCISPEFSASVRFIWAMPCKQQKGLTTYKITTS